MKTKKRSVVMMGFCVSCQSEHPVAEIKERADGFERCSRRLTEWRKDNLENYNDDLDLLCLDVSRDEFRRLCQERADERNRGDRPQWHHGARGK